MRQHVQPAPVRHPDDHLGGARVGRRTREAVEHRHYHVHALDAEALLPEERPVEELLERVDARKAHEQALGRLVLVAAVEAPGLDGLPEPEPLLRIGHVAEVVAGGVAVDVPELLDGLPSVVRALGDGPADDQGRQGLQVLVLNPVERRVERRVAGGLAPQRVELRGHVAEVPYVPDVLGGPDGLLHVELGRYPLSTARGGPVRGAVRT